MPRKQSAVRRSRRLTEPQDDTPASPLDEYQIEQTEYQRSVSIEEDLSEKLLTQLRRTRKLQKRIEHSDPLSAEVQDLIFQLPGEIRMYLHALHEYTTFTGRMLRRNDG